MLYHNKELRVLEFLVYECEKIFKNYENLKENVKMYFTCRECVLYEYSRAIYKGGLSYTIKQVS
jgi:hypothetical protein